MRYLALVSVFLGCGDNGSTISFEQRTAAETRARCERLARCGEFSTAESCIAFFRPRLEASLARAVEIGIVKFDPFNEEQCLRDLAEASCDRTHQTARLASLACQGALIGTITTGAACAFDEECVSGRCAVELCPALQCCPGTCLGNRNTVGGDCMVDRDCVDDAFCSTEKKCVALAKAGAACRADRQCVFGLACVGATPSEAGACRALPALGESCPYDRCADINARCNASGTCVAVGLPGASCASDVECSQYARCSGSICVDVPTLGMPCDSICGGEAFCDNGTCVAPLENSTPCNADGECASQLCVEGPIFAACATSPVCI